jgi:uncharacterized membrane protein YgdD (TMEM256/DUF423 family)
VFAAAAGFTAVAAGAFGAHALQPFLTANGRVETWQTAVLYHLIHAVVLLAIALARHRETEPVQTRRLTRGGDLFAAGIVLFSGSLYALALGAPRWLGPVTPLGGCCFLAGWLAVGHALWPRKT